MKTRTSLTSLVAALLVTTALADRLRAAETPVAPEEDGVALMIIYDTSGSMAESVRDSQGGRSPKIVIARRAMNAVVDRLQAFIVAGPTNPARTVRTGLIVFGNGRPETRVSLRSFEPAVLRDHISRLRPNGATPLGNAIQLATDSVLSSHLTRKHILVITDGINTSGPDPQVVLPRLQDKAQRQGTRFSVHFVAFDVDAKVFDPVKKLGALVVGAADEKQLNTQLEFILEKKILMENEEPPTKAPTK